jgi:hypothetical protein
MGQYLFLLFWLALYHSWTSVSFGRYTSNRLAILRLFCVETKVSITQYATSCLTRWWFEGMEIGAESKGADLKILVCCLLPLLGHGSWRWARKRFNGENQCK